MQRSERVGDEIRTVLSSIIRNDLKDPRIPAVVSVVGVRVTRDLSHAYAHVSVLAGDEEKKDCARALNRAAGYIRREIGHRMRLRVVPEIHFVFDESIERGFEITRKLDEVMGRSVPGDDDADPTDGVPS